MAVWLVFALLKVLSWSNNAKVNDSKLSLSTAGVVLRCVYLCPVLMASCPYLELWPRRRGRVTPWFSRGGRLLRLVQSDNSLMFGFRLRIGTLIFPVETGHIHTHH